MKVILFVSFLALCCIGCRSEKERLIQLEGSAQGTTYHIVYTSSEKVIKKKSIDSIIKVIDNSMSTYLPGSLISRVNSNDKMVLLDDHFKNVYHKSWEVSEKTGGLFDVTVGPLVNAWGFGFKKKASVNRHLVDSLLPGVGYKMLSLEGDKIVKARPQIVLDFNAIAQGYTVDVLAAYLDSEGISNYLVELGGELKAKGKKFTEDWKVGIDQPNAKDKGERKLEAVIKLNDKAMATSGNYRKYYEENGQKFSHIIDPRTGYPAKQNILSATVIANDCMTADAYATAFMIMGLKNAEKFLVDNANLNLEVFFVYDELGKWKTFASPSLQPDISRQN